MTAERDGFQQRLGSRDALAMLLGLTLLTANPSACLVHAAELANGAVPLMARADQPGRRLVDVLDAFEAAGHAFVYSTDLVRDSTLVHYDLAQGVSIPALKSALERIHLTLEPAGDGEVDGRTWYVVPFHDSSEPQRIEGRVTDAHSGQPLAGVRIEIAGVVVFSDAMGRFQVPDSSKAPLPVRSATPAEAGAGSPLLVSRAGYQPVQVPLDERLDAALEISLTAERRIEEVVVVSSRYALERRTGSSVHSLTAHDIDSLPEFGDDALRAANHLPGTASIGLSARPYIRGGLQDETLVLFNNVELVEPFHLKDFQSLFSGFNPSLVKSIDVYTGGFPVRYGNRMSGVMDIKPPGEMPGFGADVMLSFLTASAAVFGTSQEGRGTWALSARRGNFDLVLDVLDPSAGKPRYADYFGSYAYDFGENTRVEAGFIFYDDDIELKDLDDGDGELATSIYRNGYGWLQLHRDWSENNRSTTVLSYGRIRNDRSGFINDEDLEEGSSSLDDERRFQIWHLGHRQHLLLSEAWSLEFGGRLNYQKGRYESHALFQRGELGALIGLPEFEERLVSLRPDGSSGGVYGSARWLPYDWLSLEAGLRWDYQDYGPEFAEQLSPRLSALIGLSEHTDLRVSMGRFYQAEQIHELQAADGVSEFQPAQHADHLIVGLQHQFGHTGFSTRVEGFRKWFADPKLRYENLFNSLVLMPELASDRISVAPSRARSRGVELTLAYEPGETLSSWVSYTHAYAEDRLDGAWVERGWDQRHTVSAGVVWEPGNWTVSAALLWHSGWQTTLLPPTVAEDELPILERNGDRLPDYLALDFRISRIWRWPNQSLTLFFELTNAFDRSNVGAIEYDVAENETGDGLLISGEPVTLLPRIPSLGVRWTFN